MICMVQLILCCHPVISCFIKIQIRLTFLVPACPDCPGKEDGCMSDKAVFAHALLPLGPARKRACIDLCSVYLIAIGKGQ